MSRIFLSHSSRDTRQAIALKAWLTEQRPELADEIFIDVDAQTGLRLGEHWKTQLFTGNSRCEYVVCLLSQNWLDSTECNVEYRTAEGLGKRILVARLEDCGDNDTTAAWQRCDLFTESEQADIEVPDGPPIRFSTAALNRILEAVDGGATRPRQFVWPPKSDPNRAPYRGWQPFEDIDAGVFFGRDVVIARGVDVLRGMRFRLLATMSGLKSLFVVLGPSGSGKSSFLRAGLIPRLQRQDRQFVVLGIMRPHVNALTGDSGLAPAIHRARESLGLKSTSLGYIRKACGDRDVGTVLNLLTEIRGAAAQHLVSTGEAPTLVLPIDQAEELFAADRGPQAEQFLTMLAELIRRINADEVGLIGAVTIRTDRYEAMQNHPALDGIGTALFDDLKPMPREEFKDVITGPAARATEAGQRLVIGDDLVARLLSDAGEGADTLPLLALTLSRLYADYGATGEITAADYEAMGGMTDVVNNEIEEILRRHPEGRDDALKLLRSAFVPWLAAVNSTTDQALRRVALESDLPKKSRPLIDAFVARRLLVRDEREGEVVIEVALESLLRQWDELVGWLAEERLNLKMADDIQRSAAAWENQDRDPAWLFTGTRLNDAEILADRRGFSILLAGSREFLGACREAENKRLDEMEAQRNEKLHHAEEVARLAQDSQRSAEREAYLARKRSQARGVVALVAILGAVAATYGLVTANRARHQADARTREAIAVRLTSEARAMLAGAQGGGDMRAFEEILAAPHVSRTADTGALYDALVARPDTLKIVGTQGPAMSLAVSADGHHLATGQADGTVRMFNADTGQPIGAPFKGHQGSIGAVAFSPDGHRIVSGGMDHDLRIWNADTGQPIGEPLVGHTGWVTGVAFSPDGRRIVSGSDDKTIRLWDAATHLPIGGPWIGHTDWVLSVAFSPDGRRVASGSDDKTVRLWNADTGQPIGTPMIGHTDWVDSVAFRPDGRRIVSASYDKTLRIWDADTGRPTGYPLVGHSGPVSTVTYSPDGRHIASGGQDDLVRVWDADTGQPVGDALDGHTSWVTGVAYSPDGRHIISSSNDGTVREWVAGIKVIAAHLGAVNSADFSPDGRRIVSAGDVTLRLWDTDSGLPIGVPLTGHTDGVTDVAFSPDGRFVVSGGYDKTLRLWDTDTGQQVGEMTGHKDAVADVAFSPDGRQIASGSFDKTLRRWDVATRQPLGDPLSSNSGEVASVAYSPDGHRIVTGNEDDSVRIWNAATGEPIGKPLIGHKGTVNGVAFSPNGQRIMSGSADKTLRMWDAGTGQPIGQPLLGHLAGVNSVAFSHDGQLAVSSADDGTVRLWPAPPQAQWISLLCDKLSANMTQGEWNDWVSPNIGYAKVCPNLPDPGS